jgi:uncharacterized protein (TIGR02284 family)
MEEFAMAKATGSENKELLSALEELATEVRDSEQGYKHSAENAKDGDLRSMFSDLSRERRTQAEELDRIIQRLGGTPPSSQGSTAGTAHRLWTDLKSTLTGGDRRSILQEVVRGESYLEECYDKALKQDLRGMTFPEDVQQTLQQQHSSARNSRNRFRSMLGAMGGAQQQQGRTMGSLTSGVEHYVVEKPMMGTALALGLGMVLGVLLSMSMRSGTSSSYGGRQSGYRGRQTGYGYGYGDQSRAGYGSGRSGYGYGSTGQSSGQSTGQSAGQSGYGYGTAGQAGYGAGTQARYGESGSTGQTTGSRT